ncbi:hypothetical protein [Actinomadura madurae]|uniref:hypothetical protein n=1 Tax=Actinomadura madurae TaxID=1993 RepID=UPI0020D21799|nr:hypothetical protein [Actinomadura madurae]MCP9978261.1 hypothetical protein [Actinomadura madurae]
MFTYSSTGEPVRRDARASTMAAAASNSGYSTSRVTASGPRSEAVVNITRAQTTANPKRAKYSRRRLKAVPAMLFEAMVVTVVPSTKEVKRTFCLLHGSVGKVRSTRSGSTGSSPRRR